LHENFIFCVEETFNWGQSGVGKEVVELIYESKTVTVKSFYRNFIKMLAE
jgi:hypothetical protein